MAILFADDAETIQLVDENGIPLTDEDVPDTPVQEVAPLFLLLRAMLHN